MNVTREELLPIIEESGVSVDVASIKSDISLSKAGIDSLEMMNIFLAIEEKLGIKIPDEDFDSLDTMDDIIAYLQRL